MDPQLQELIMHTIIPMPSTPHNIPPSKKNEKKGTKNLLPSDYGAATRLWIGFVICNHITLYFDSVVLIVIVYTGWYNPDTLYIRDTSA